MALDLPDKKLGCHRTGFARKCHALVTSGQCNRWLAIRGKNPNTGEDVDRHDCIDNWTPMLLIENSQQQRQTAAAIESFRNEMVKANNLALVTRLSDGRMTDPDRRLTDLSAPESQ